MGVENRPVSAAGRAEKRAKKTEAGEGRIQEA